MTFPELPTLNDAVSRLLKDGAPASARRTLIETVPTIIRRRFSPTKSINFLVHYTSIDALYSMLGLATNSDDPVPSSPKNTQQVLANRGFLRMYDTYHSNDPNEGLFFVGSVPQDHAFLTTRPSLWEILQRRSKNPAYVASFRGVSKRDEVDNLVYWRTYGREGKGCAIVIPVSTMPPKAPLYEVRYGENEVVSTIDYLANLFEELSSLPVLREPSLKDTYANVPKYVESILSPIIYLHKSRDYVFEREVRLVAPSVDLPARSLFFQRVEDRDSGVTIRHFAHLPELNIGNILRTDSVIMFGPAVRSRRNLEFVLGERLIQLALVGVTFEKSKIAYGP